MYTKTYVFFWNFELCLAFFMDFDLTGSTVTKNTKEAFKRIAELLGWMLTILFCVWIEKIYQRK